MQRMMAQYLPREMAVLGLLEAALSFAAIYAMIPPDGASALLPEFLYALPHDSVVFAAILTLVTGTIGLFIGLYRTDVCLDRRRLAATAGAAAAIVFVVMLAASHGRTEGFSARHAMFIARSLGAWLVTMSLIRMIHAMTAGRAGLIRRVLLIGGPQQVALMKTLLRSRRGSGFDPVILGDAEVSWTWLRRHRLWGIVVGSDAPELAMAGLLDCRLRGMTVLSDRVFHEHYLGRIEPDRLVAEDLMTTDGFNSSRAGAIMKRLTDLAFAIVMLLLTLPLMLFTALAIYLDSPGSILYRQERAGQYDTAFTLFKFRSMRIDAEAGGAPCWAQRQDPRITRVGRFIRATRIDELPQLVNVIRGDMSLVGPRPERPHFVAQLARAIPFYRERGYVKPGLTGWAQVNFPYGASVEDAREKLAYDLYYLKNRSFLLDMMILLSTIRVVLRCQGAR